MVMRKDVSRTTVDLPAPLYRRLKEQAARQGCSIRELLVTGAERVLLEKQPPARKPVRFPLIHSRGPKVEVPAARLYEFIEFP